MKPRYRRLMAALLLCILSGIVAFVWDAEQSYEARNDAVTPAREVSKKGALARDVLATLEVKGRAPKTEYRRSQFGDGWARVGRCDTRNAILQRDLVDEAVSDTCKVLRGTLRDPYTDKTIQFVRGADTSDKVQIDHVVALSDAWQKGAQQLSRSEREEFANDPLNLLAVDGDANQEKSASDAASWLPSHKPFRCQYVARQIAVKARYTLWITAGEKRAMERVLRACPEERVLE